MAPVKGRAKQFQDDEELVKDYDPEAEGQASESGTDDSENEKAGTEHYETVGKSKLRQKENVSLGPQYRGSKVSRQALEQESEEEEVEDDDDSEDGEEYADPDLVDIEADEAEASDSEIESDNALAESDAERFKDFVFRGSSKPVINGKVQARKRATAADYMSSSSDEQGDQGLVEDSEEDVSDEDDMDDGLDALAEGGDSDSDAEDDEMDQQSDGEEDEDGQDDEESDSQSEDDESLAKKAAPRLVPGAATAAPTSARPDLEKGIAIQKQRKTYDELLNLRIRLQKALVAANTISLIDGESIETPEPYEAAEEAAINLLNTISNLKDRFGQTGGKRKRELSVSMPSKELWEHLQEDEESLRQFRQDRLEKWSKKVQSATVTTSSRLGAKSKTLVNVLEDQLGDPTSRLVKRTRVARSCAPAQAAKRVTEDDYIYDDADFYQQLLKELVEQRTVDNSGEQIGAVPSVMLTAANSAKTRKVVDRKASKGRKMRFTVHEKLQNFMAPEDRRTWEQGAIDRLFNTLFGQKMEMDENESEGDDMDELQAQADGLRLFK